MRLVVAAILVDDPQRPTRVLAARRTAEGDLTVVPGQLWEFPGGKVEPGESPREALQRELVEELAISARIHNEVPPPSGGTWPISETLELRCFVATTLDRPDPGSAVDPSHDAVRWLTASELADVPWLPSNASPAREIAAAMTRRLVLGHPR